MQRDNKEVAAKRSRPKSRKGSAVKKGRNGWFSVPGALFRPQIGLYKGLGV